MTGKQLLKERPLLYADMMGLRKATGKHSSCVVIALSQKSRTKQPIRRWQRDYPNAVLFLFICGQPSTETHASVFPPRRLFNPSTEGFPSHPHCWLLCS